MKLKAIIRMAEEGDYRAELGLIVQPWPSRQLPADRLWAFS
jgi:hypothetical protein